MARRRRLQLRCSSDEEEEEHRGEPEEVPPTVTSISPVSNPNPSPINPLPNVIHVEISDEDFVDVEESFSPPSPPSPNPNPPFQDSTSQRSTTTTPVFTFTGSTDSSVNELLQNRGLKLRGEWLDSCISGLSNSVPGFSRFSVVEKAKLCFQQFLFADMNFCGNGVLPQNVHSMHLVDLPGPFVLQVDEIVNISCPLRDRYQNAPAGIKRCLKLCMTDGIQCVFGMEYRPIKDLEVMAPAGLKVVIHNVNVRRGLLMLVPEVVEVLGGLVEDLDAARERLVAEINKPPRGKRTRTGTLPSLASRATLAAWPANGVSDQGNADNPTSQGVIPPQSSDQDTPYAQPATHARARVMEDYYIPNTTSNMEHNSSLNTAAAVNETATPASSFNISRARTVEDFDIPNTRSNMEHIPFGSTATVINEINMADATAAMSEIDITEPTVEEFVASNRSSSAGVNPSSNAVPNVAETDVVDEVENPLLTADKEVPFTYLASLLAEWAVKKDETASLQGKIKCFLTGVKGFQFKNRTKYDLQVYVDDGSLIYEVSIDHNVVLKGIGHSPEEVTVALASSNKNVVSHMKETMKQFQIFLANFEGTILVEMNNDSSLPVAIEMDQGCPTSDAWLLLKRVNMYISPQTPRYHDSEPITISP